MDEITLPRAVVAALVDPEERLYAADWGVGQCQYCEGDYPGNNEHKDSCPVHIAQEALAKQPA